MREGLGGRREGGSLTVCNPLPFSLPTPARASLRVHVSFSTETKREKGRAGVPALGWACINIRVFAKPIGVHNLAVEFWTPKFGLFGVEGSG